MDRPNDSLDDETWLAQHAGLDEALTKTISVRRLDHSFDRVVWERISEERRAAAVEFANPSRRLNTTLAMSLINWTSSAFTATAVLIGVWPHLSVTSVIGSGAFAVGATCLAFGLVALRRQSIFDEIV